MSAAAEQMLETPKDAARRLSAPALRDGYKPEALHAYVDERGAPLHWRIRLRNPTTLEKWIRPMRANGTGFEIGEPKYASGKPLYNLSEIARKLDEVVFVVEGEWAVDHLARRGVLATTSGGADSAGAADWSPLAGRDVVVWPDNDEPGQRYAEAVCERLRALGCMVRTLDVAALDLPAKGDCVDWLTTHSSTTPKDVLALPFVSATVGVYSEVQWPEPLPLPADLLPVPAFPADLLPDRLRPWVSDIAERVQCAPEFVAVPAMVSLGSLIGRRVGIRPQALTDWTEIPNLWGCIVGRPGVLKSPAMTAALAPLERLAARAREEHAKRSAQDAAEAEARDLRAALAKAEAKKRLTRDRGADVSDLLTPQEAIATPPARRYSTNDTSYQALAELLIQNPNGLLVVRDELVSLLAALDAEENAEARGFYLTGWNGNQGYTVDRIDRGLGRHVEAVTLGMIGGTQPGRLASYINAANRGGAGDDGLIQRFGLLVWPDLGGEWRNVDRRPDHQAKRDAFEVFARLDGLTPEAIGAEQDTDHMGEPTGTPFLRFAPDALEEFTSWRTALECVTLRGGDTPPALESHFAKYRKHIPVLALICHLADGGTGAVSLEATLRAIAWAEYLEPHARRAYGSGPVAAVQAARLILKRIRDRALPDAFTARDVYRPQWSGLTDRDTVREALLLLEDHAYLVSERLSTGGAPTIVYSVNPRGST